MGYELLIIQRSTINVHNDKRAMMIAHSVEDSYGRD